MVGLAVALGGDEIVIAIGRIMIGMIEKSVC